MGEVRTTQSLQLRVQVREVAALQQRIVAEVDARRNVLRHERDLFGFCEKVVGHPIKNKAADRLNRQNLLRDDLRRVENVEIEIVGKFLIEELDAQFPLGKIT